LYTSLALAIDIQRSLRHLFSEHLPVARNRGEQRLVRSLCTNLSVFQEDNTREIANRGQPVRDYDNRTNSNKINNIPWATPTRFIMFPLLREYDYVGISSGISL